MSFVPRGRNIRLVICGGGSLEISYRIWIGRGATFADVMEVLNSINPTGDFVLLEAKWGPAPFWRKAAPSSFIKPSCQVLYAVLRRKSARYVVGLERSSQSDRPVVVYQPQNESHLTLSRALFESHEHPEQTTSILDYVDDRYIGNDQLDYRELERAHPSTFPTVFRVMLDKPSSELMSELPYMPAPTVLQVPFQCSKRLVKCAYDLKSFALQMIYLSSAIRHLIVSLGNRMSSPDEKEIPDIGEAFAAGGDMADLLQVAPLLSNELQALLDALDEIMDTIESKNAHRTDIQVAIQMLYIATCGDYPGAITIRHSDKHFQSLTQMDHDDDNSQAPALSGVINTSDRTAHNAGRNQSEDRRPMITQDADASGNEMMEVENHPVSQTSTAAQGGAAIPQNQASLHVAQALTPQGVAVVVGAGNQNMNITQGAAVFMGLQNQNANLTTAQAQGGVGVVVAQNPNAPNAQAGVAVAVAHPRRAESEVNAWRSPDERHIDDIFRAFL